MITARPVRTHSLTATTSAPALEPLPLVAAKSFDMSQTVKVRNGQLLISGAAAGQSHIWLSFGGTKEFSVTILPRMTARQAAQEIIRAAGGSDIPAGLERLSFKIVSTKQGVVTLQAALRPLPATPKVAAQENDSSQSVQVKKNVITIRGNASGVPGNLSPQPRSRFTLEIDGGRTIQIPMPKGQRPNQTAMQIASRLPEGYKAQIDNRADGSSTVTIVRPRVN